MHSHGFTDGTRHPLTRLAALSRSSVLLALCCSLGSVSQAATDYLFVPGHGLTAKSKNAATITTQNLIDECKATGPWMTFVEREYAWADLQNDGPVGTNTPGSFITGVDALGNPKGISKIVDDAKKCAAAPGGGLKLRVMLMHKFAALPRFLTYPASASTTVDGKYAVVIARDANTGAPTNYNIKLDYQDSHGAVVLQYLEALYQKVIDELKKPGNETARDAFYGFVIQEHAFGTSTYWTNTTRTNWVSNLLLFHDYLAAHLVNFAPSTTASKPHRLFWQMVNSPTADAQTIIDSMPVGGGLCGPDTFPREPAPGATSGAPNRVSLFQTYQKMRAKRGVMPLSLHVYAANFWNPYVHADQEVTATGDMLPHLGPQPIWGRDAANAIDSYTEPGLGASMLNDHSGTGIANFLGTVSPWAKKTPAEGGQGEPDNMQVNNVVWAFTTYVSNEAELQGFVPPDSNGPNDAYGWNNVKSWMKTSTNNQFPNGLHTTPTSPPDPAGGCTVTIPSMIIK